MGYKIVYGKPARKPVRLLRLQSLVAVGLLMFAICVRLSWPAGHQLLRQVLVSQQLCKEAEALVAMAEDLAAGEKVTDIVAVFCQEVFGG